MEEEWEDENNCTDGDYCSFLYLLSSEFSLRWKEPPELGKGNAGIYIWIHMAQEMKYDIHKNEP